MQKFIKALPDAMIVAGVGAIAYGAWLLHPSAGFVVGGALTVTFGVIAARSPKAAE